MLVEIGTGVFCAAVGIQLLYYLLLFGRLAMRKEKHYLSEKLPPVTVVICSKNDAANLERCLKLVMIQLYADYEVLIVNDRSTDHTLEVVAHFASRNENIRLFNIPTNEPKKELGKKQALQLGVTNAKHDIVVVTDADCRPASTNWLQLVVGNYLNNTSLVLGYAPFFKEKSWLNKLIRYENVMTAAQYFSYALAGLPYMGVGRNMSFRKSEFLDWKNSSTNLPSISSGDDDLFVNAKATAAATEISLDKDSFVFSQAKKTAYEWLQQKKRHVRAGFYYRLYHRLLLFLFALSKFLFYTTLPVLFIKSIMWLPALLLLGSTLLVMWAMMMRINSKLHQNDLTAWFLPLDIAYTYYLLLLFFLTSTSRKDIWKETYPHQK